MYRLTDARGHKTRTAGPSSKYRDPRVVSTNTRVFSLPSALSCLRVSLRVMVLFGDGSRGGATPYSFSLRPRSSVMPFQPHLHSQLLLQPVGGQMLYDVERLALAAGGGELDRPHIPRNL